MAEWLFEEGIGENRAALIEDGTIIEAVIELPGMLRAGGVVAGRLSAILIPSMRGIITFQNGKEALLEPIPAGVTEGAALNVEIVREAISEKGRSKRPKVKATDKPPAPGPTLYKRIIQSRLPVRNIRPKQDELEQAGWSELLEQAISGEIPFPGGSLSMSVTPTMTLFDVDGNLPPAELALAGAEAAARAILRFGIAGSIGIDLPTTSRKEDRQAPASIIDRILPQPFERTAVNGFGFVQIIRRKLRPSLPEILLADPIGAAARALLRRAERTPGKGDRTISAAPEVIERLQQRTDMLNELQRRLGASVILRAEAGLAISAGHVQSQFN